MAGFFSMFPKVGYNFKPLGINQNIIDIFRSVRNQGSFIDNPSTYAKHTIINGDRPDIVSHNLYGTPDFYWTFFVINDFLNEGHSAWPMSQESLNEYMSKYFNGTVVETRPQVIKDTDGIVTEYRNSLSGKFQLGETITGSLSLATGTVKSKNADLSQITITDVNGTFQENEEIIGSVTSDSVGVFKVYPEAIAPDYWYTTGDVDQRQVQPDSVIPSGVPRHQCSYISKYEQIVTTNDQRSQIRVVDPAYITEFVKLFKDTVNV
jgi:hypothetical protein